MVRRQRTDWTCWARRWKKHGPRNVIIFSWISCQLRLLHISLERSYAIDYASNTIGAHQRGGEGFHRCVRHEFEAIAAVASDEGQENSGHRSRFHEWLQNRNDLRTQRSIGNGLHLSAYTACQIDGLRPSNCQFDEETQVKFETLGGTWVEDWLSFSIFRKMWTDCPWQWDRLPRNRIMDHWIDAARDPRSALHEILYCERVWRLDLFVQRSGQKWISQFGREPDQRRYLLCKSISWKID